MNIGQQNALVPYPCRVEELSESDSEDNENPVQHNVVVTVGEKFNGVLDLGVDGVASVFTSVCRGVSFIGLSLLGGRTAENGEQKVKNALDLFFKNRIVRVVMKVALVLTAAYLLLRLCFPAIAEQITSFIGAMLTSVGTFLCVIDPKPTPDPKPANPNFVIVNDDKNNNIKSTLNSNADSSKNTVGVGGNRFSPGDFWCNQD